MTFHKLLSSHLYSVLRNCQSLLLRPFDGSLSTTTATTSTLDTAASTILNNGNSNYNNNNGSPSSSLSRFLLGLIIGGKEQQQQYLPSPASSFNYHSEMVYGQSLWNSTDHYSLHQEPPASLPSLILAEQIANILSICVIVFSFLCSLFVLINLCKKNMKAEREEKSLIDRYEYTNPSLVEPLTTKKHLYTKLISFCILCMIISDLLFTTFYFPTNTLRLIRGFLFEDLPKSEASKIDPYFTIPIYITAEITEMFVISSGFFSMLLTLCIYKTIKSIKPSVGNDNDSNYSQSTRSPIASYNNNQNNSYGTSDNYYANNNNQDQDDYYANSGNDRLITASPQSETSVNTPPHDDYDMQNNENIQQTSLKGRYEKLQKKKGWYQLGFCLISWGLPGVLAIVWIVVEELYLGGQSAPRDVFFANIIPDVVKNMIYIAIEVASLALRIMIYWVTKKLFRDTTIVHNTPSAKKKREKERNLFKQLLFYALPFFLFGVWVIVYRLATDIIYVVRVAEHGLDSFSDDLDLPGLIVLSIHHILSPLRAFANSVVYCLLSKWFSDRVKGSFRRCCGQRN
ncbi:predicted protein [Naegleria gruberi]|uniref:Predicted protein n=2 Tax=Naegleria gruberi TaxID=5762 RepID=D2VQ11_NAEGR|nr:uncharacterized protein NAEGRDRAFT_58910 [Naegleria gruberi]EFC41029.1 predicted protein [Naegleria gruberi]|eukprot:XP_002673773.1 predicted protein [Naegleria gruberi strain NEG-M]